MEVERKNRLTKTANPDHVGQNTNVANPMQLPMAEMRNLIVGAMASKIDVRFLRNS